MSKRIVAHTDNCGPLSGCRESCQLLTDEQLDACENHDCCSICHALGMLQYLDTAGLFVVAQAARALAEVRSE